MRLIKPVALIVILSSIFMSCKQEGGFKAKLDPKVLAEIVHDNIVSIDTHTDTPLNFKDSLFDIGKWNDFDSSDTRVDFPRMKKGRLDAVFMAAFISQGERNDSSNQKAKQKTLKLIEAIKQNVSVNAEQASMAMNSKDIFNIRQNNKSAVYIGIENGYPLGTDLSNVKLFYDLGARYITLCHSKNNDICDSSTDKDGAEFNGLSAFGEEVVREMNKLGMMIDVSHISDSAYFDVLKLSKTPVIASHSSVRALCDHPRNFSDEMLEALKKNNGVIQICILSSYIKKDEPNSAKDSAMADLRRRYNNFNNLSEEEYKKGSDEWRAIQKKYPGNLATVSDAVDHIDYVVKKIGIDHVGIGTDFDGGGGLKDCRDASELKNITLELLKRGYKERDIAKIWGENFLRVFKEVENSREL